jgi:hypothetical protein
MDSHICSVISKMKYMILFHSNEYLKCINVLTNTQVLVDRTSYAIKGTSNTGTLYLKYHSIWLLNRQ